jgi:hypothetical protein
MWINDELIADGDLIQRYIADFRVTFAVSDRGDLPRQRAPSTEEALLSV